MQSFSTSVPVALARPGVQLDQESLSNRALPSAQVKIKDFGLTWAAWAGQSNTTVRTAVVLGAALADPDRLRANPAVPSNANIEMIEALKRARFMMPPVKSTFYSETTFAGTWLRPEARFGYRDGEPGPFGRKCL